VARLSVGQEDLSNKSKAPIFHACKLFFSSRIHPGRCTNRIEERPRRPAQRQEWLQLNATPHDTRLTTPTLDTRQRRLALHCHPPRIVSDKAQNPRTASRPKMEIPEADPDSRSQRINVLQTHKRLEESASRQQDPTRPERHRRRSFTTVYIAPRRLML
jgi:hypothetical protein